MADSPTQRTLKYMRDRGCMCGVVERFNPYGGAIVKGKRVGIRIDLFNIIDIICLDHSRGVLGIQACGQSHAAHYRKLTEEKREESIFWLKTPRTSLFIYAWRKVKVKRGMKAIRWEPRVTEITLKDLEEL